MSEFLILGGTGKVGSRVSHVLAASGHEPRVAGRRARTRFDWREESSWAPALEGADGVFVVGPGSATDWSPALSRFLGQAARAGVQHAVLLSARGVEFLPAGVVALVERTLAAGPLPWTILRPTHFSQNFTESMFVPRNGVIRAPVGDGREPFIDALDIAEVAAAVLTSPDDDRYRGTTLALSGPEAVTFAEAAAILSKVAGTHVEFVPQTGDEHVAELRASGTPEGYVRWRTAMLGGIARGEDAYLSDGVPRALGRPARGFEEWALREVPGPARTAEHLPLPATDERPAS